MRPRILLTNETRACVIEGCGWVEKPPQYGTYVSVGHVCPRHAKEYDAQGKKLLTVVIQDIQYVHEKTTIISNTTVQISEQFQPGTLSQEGDGGTERLRADSGVLEVRGETQG